MAYGICWIFIFQLVLYNSLSDCLHLALLINQKSINQKSFKISHNPHAYNSYKYLPFRIASIKSQKCTFEANGNRANSELHLSRQRQNVAQKIETRDCAARGKVKFRTGSGSRWKTALEAARSGWWTSADTRYQIPDTDSPLQSTLYVYLEPEPEPEPRRLVWHEKPRDMTQPRGRLGQFFTPKKKSERKARDFSLFFVFFFNFCLVYKFFVAWVVQQFVICAFVSKRCI